MHNIEIPDGQAEALKAKAAAKGLTLESWLAQLAEPVAPVKFLRFFCVYSHQDEALRQELHAYLESRGLFDEMEYWYDYELKAGQDFSKEIERRLERADVFLFLLSDAFLSSDFINNKEAKRAVERFHAGEALIIPVDLGLTKGLPGHLAFLCNLQWLPDYPKMALTGNPVPAESGLNEAADAKRQQIYEKVAEGVRRALGNRNHLLISDESPFSSELRSRLLERRFDLGIGRVHSFRDPSSGGLPYIRRYENLLSEFLGDRVRDNCVFTIYPDESVTNGGEEAELVKELSEKGKGIICFESGTSLLDAAVKEESGGRALADRNPACVIRTKHSKAASELTVEVERFLSDARGIKHVVMLPGPPTPNSLERWGEYHQFLSRLLGQYCGSAPDPSRGGAVAITVNSTPPNWSKDPNLAREVFDCLRLDPASDSLCIICANDEAALCVSEAFEQHVNLGEDCAMFDRRRALLVGFDGISAMREAIQAGKPMLTMAVDQESMCRRACDVFAKRPYDAKPHELDARIERPMR